MGTKIYGSYDELVIELHGLDRLRAGRGAVRVAVDDVWRVRAVDPRTLVSWDGERVLRVGGHRSTVLVLDLRASAAYDRIVVGVAGADVVAEDLQRSGIGSLVGA